MLDKFGSWQFKIEEISNSVYKVIGTDNYGRSIEKVGIDPDELLDEIKKDALAMNLYKND